MKLLSTLIVFIGFLIYSLSLLAQNYDEIIFSDFKKYANKIDSIKSNSDLLILSEARYSPDDFDLSSFLQPYSYFSPNQNSLFAYNTNLFGIPLSKSEFFFENVNLNDNFFGGYDLSNFPRFFADELTVDKVQNNNLSGANSLSSAIFTEFASQIENQLKLHFHGGNYYGSGAAKYNGNYNNYYWNSGFAYKNSAGYNYPQTNSEARDLKNSQQEKAALFAKIGIKDNNSDISFSFMHIDNDKGIPENMFTTENNLFLRETQWKSDLFNFRFNSEINNNFIARGNFYYYKYKQILDNYDNNDYDSQGLDNSFRNINDNYKFGANLIADLNNEFLKSYTLFLNYERTLFKNQLNYGLELMKTETEQLTFGFAKTIVDIENMKLAFNSKYHLFNLIFTDFSPKTAEKSYSDASLSFTFLNSDEFVFNADINYSAKIPEVALMVDSANNFSKLEKSINSEASIKWLPNNSFQITGSVFYSNLIDAIYFPDLFFGRNEAVYYDDIIYGINSNFNLNLYNYKLDFDYKYLVSQNDYYYYSPQNQMNLTLSKRYKFGFEWLVYLHYSSERQFREGTQSLPEFSVLNIRLSQIIQNRYEVYLRLDNVLEEYYEYYTGTPQPGMLFSAGVKIKLGL